MFRHRHHMGTVVALVLALALVAVAPAAASARPYPAAAAAQTHTAPGVDPRSRDATNAVVASIQAQGARVARELAARDAANESAIATFPPPKIVKISQHNNFLIDAMIGAGAMLGLVLVLLGLSFVTIHRRALHINQAH
jgi:hypothetical protein